MIRVLYTAVIIVTLIACTNSSGKSMADIADSALHSTTAPKVLVELFTSQGCSSCPAAEKLVGGALRLDTNIITLSFHVDYWDRLGWKDVFSNHDYTVRQEQYVKALHAESLYTPQAVVQGRYEMVGSNRTRVLDAINKASALQAGQTIDAAAVVQGSNIQLRYVISAKLPRQQMVIALVQNKATTAIGKGENSGAQLTDYNVVRNLIIQPVQDNGNIALSLPDDLQIKDASIVLFTQEEQTKAVAAVTQLRL